MKAINETKEFWEKGYRILMCILCLELLKICEASAMCMVFLWLYELCAYLRMSTKGKKITLATGLTKFDWFMY